MSKARLWFDCAFIVTGKATTADYGLLVFLACLLGSNFMFTSIAVASIPAFVFVFARLLIACILLLALMWFAGQRLPRGKIWWPLIGSGIFGYTMPFSLIAWGQTEVDSGIAAILMATMPLFTLAMAQIFTQDEKPNRYSIVGFLLALCGVVFLFGFEKVLAMADESVRQFAIVGGAICFGLNAVITKWLVGLRWQQMTASLLLVSVVASLPLLLAVPWPSVETWAQIAPVVLYTGIGPTALGAVLIILIVQRMGASFLSQLNFIVPVVGVFCGVLFLGEIMPPNAFLALALILAGVAIARRRPNSTIISKPTGV